MNIKSITRTCLTAMFLLLLTVTFASAERPGRIPPNVQKYPAASIEQTSFEMHTSYTSHSSGKVIDYYRKTLNTNPAEEGKFLLGTDATFKDKVGHTDASLWLNIYPARRALKDNELFGFLHQEVIVKKIHSKQELEQVKKKYSHLASAWYPKVDAKKKLSSCSKAARNKVTASKKREPRRNKKQEKEMLAQMQALMAQGRHQEAAQLAQASARPGMDTSRAIRQENKTDHWNKWIACLDELDKHDFRTKIEIDLYSRHFKANKAEEPKSKTSGATKKLKRLFKF